MRPKQTYLCSGRKAIFCLYLLLLFSLQAHAQLSKRIYRTEVLYDTLVANNNRDFLYNNVTITNLTSDSISVFITITAPDGWQLTTQKVITVSLPANQNTIVPLRLLPSKSISAKWETVKIEYRLNSGMETLLDTFRVRVQEFTKFKARMETPVIVLGAYQKDITFPVYVKNTGNTAKNYKIFFYSAFLNLNYSQPIHLEPQQDTIYKIPLRLSDAQWSRLGKEEIKVQVSVEDGETLNLMQELSKIGHTLKQHSSAYQDMPTQLETGFNYQGKNNIQYYAALHGRLDINPDERVKFDVRSKTFTLGQTVNNDIYAIDYTGKRWYASAGNVMQLTDFVMDGYGVRAGHKWKQENNRIGMYALVKSRVGNNKLFGGEGELLVKNRIKLIESAIASFDENNRVYSYLAKQVATTKINEEMEASITTGVGLEQILRTIVNSDKKSQVGTSLGYSYAWNNKYVNVNSTVMYNSNSYPGIFKGQRMQIHDVRAIYNKVFVGGFYDYSLRKQNVYVDTQYFSNVFNLKTQNYGIRSGVSFSKTNVSLAVGQQVQQQSDTANAPIYFYRFANMNSSVMFANRVYLSVNAYYGNGYLDNDKANTSVPVFSGQGSMQVYFVGSSFRYDHGPYFYHEYMRYLKKPEEYRRLVLGPYGELNFWRRQFTIRSQYNYSYSLPNNFRTSSVLGSIVYHNIRHGFDFNINGVAQLDNPVFNPYINGSLRIRLHVPFVPVRKYYTLKMVLFKDENVNGKKDEGEGVIEGQMLGLNDNLFVSDEKGEIVFKNITKKDYRADFGHTSKIKGWIPQGGTIQTFAVYSNKTIYVPYKKSKVLQGKLNLDADKNSNVDFKLSNIKVVATGNDTMRASYSTLTDENGEFYFNLPAGIYTVSVSEVAFDDQFKPTEFAQQADLLNNDSKMVIFDIKQKRRAINIRKK